jgi:hypothetical protein
VPLALSCPIPVPIPGPRPDRIQTNVNFLRAQHGQIYVSNKTELHKHSLHICMYATSNSTGVRLSICTSPWCFQVSILLKSFVVHPTSHVNGLLSAAWSTPSRNPLAQLLALHVYLSILNRLIQVVGVPGTTKNKKIFREGITPTNKALSFSPHLSEVTGSTRHHEAWFKDSCSGCTRPE